MQTFILIEEFHIHTQTLIYVIHFNNLHLVYIIINDTHFYHLLSWYLFLRLHNLQIIILLLFVHWEKYFRKKIFDFPRSLLSSRKLELAVKRKCSDKKSRYVTLSSKVTCDFISTNGFTSIHTLSHMYTYRKEGTKKTIKKIVQRQAFFLLAGKRWEKSHLEIFYLASNVCIKRGWE